MSYQVGNHPTHDTHWNVYVVFSGGFVLISKITVTGAEVDLAMNSYRSIAHYEPSDIARRRAYAIAFARFADATHVRVWVAQLPLKSEKLK
jgi:hypothetical protein